MIYESTVLGATFTTTWDEKQQVVADMNRSVAQGYRVRVQELTDPADPWFAKGYRWQVDRVRD